MGSQDTLTTQPGGPGAFDADEQRRVVEAVLGASRALVGVAARSIAGLEDDVTLAQFRMLVLLGSRGPQRVADLADALDVNPSTATRMTDRLVAKRLAGRKRTLRDRRSVQVTISPTGRRLVGEVFDRRRVAIARILAAMPAESRAQLADGLSAFSAAAGEVPEPDWSVGWE